MVSIKICYSPMTVLGLHAACRPLCCGEWGAPLVLGRGLLTAVLLPVAGVGSRVLAQGLSPTGFVALRPVGPSGTRD